MLNKTLYKNLLLDNTSN